MKTPGKVTPQGRLKKDEILQQLPAEMGAIVDLVVFDQVGSTNDYLSDQLPPKAGDMQVAVAEQQTQGRGQHHRPWHSPHGVNVYFSCAVLVHKKAGELGGLSLVVAMALLEALKSLYPAYSFQIKWPNDVMFEGKKLAGILVESCEAGDHTTRVVAGVGVNVNMEAVADTDVGQPWTTVREAVGEVVDRNQLVSALIERLWLSMQDFERMGFAGFKEAWRNVDALRGRTIMVDHEGRHVTGVVQGVNKDGHLELLDNRGQSVVCTSVRSSILKR